MASPTSRKSRSGRFHQSIQESVLEEDAARKANAKSRSPSPKPRGHPGTVSTLSVDELSSAGEPSAGAAAREAEAREAVAIPSQLAEMVEREAKQTEDELGLIRMQLDALRQRTRI